MIGTQDSTFSIDENDEFGGRIEQYFQALLRLMCAYAGGLLAQQYGVGVDPETRGKRENTQPHPQLMRCWVQQQVAQCSFVERHGIDADVEKIKSNTNQYTNPDEGITRHRRNC